MFENLKAKISEIQVKESPNLSLFWDLISDFNKAVPKSLFKPRMKGHIQRAARMYFLSEVCGREIFSTKEMYGQELWLVFEWFQDFDNLIALTGWWIEHKVEIHQLAEIIKERKKK